MQQYSNVLTILSPENYDRYLKYSKYEAFALLPFWEAF
jgi:hypothetical protein